VSKQSHKALFLDRDGIINIDHGYVSKVEDFVFVEGIFDFVKLFTQEGYVVFVVTNQSGIGRGYYSQKDFETLTAFMLKGFEAQDIHIEEVYFCPHAPEAKCHCRKPNIGMIEQALSTHHIDLTHSWMIGDKQSDIDLATNAGIGSTIAIGERAIKGATLSFPNILNCKRFLEENEAIIKS